MPTPRCGRPARTGRAALAATRSAPHRARRRSTGGGRPRRDPLDDREPVGRDRGRVAEDLADGRVVHGRPDGPVACEIVNVMGDSYQIAGNDSDRSAYERRSPSSASMPPPSRLCNCTTPPLAEARWLTIARPRPEPSVRSIGRTPETVERVVWQPASDIPFPRSRTRTLDPLVLRAPHYHLDHRAGRGEVVLIGSVEVVVDDLLHGAGTTVLAGTRRLRLGRRARRHVPRRADARSRAAPAATVPRRPGRCGGPRSAASRRRPSTIRCRRSISTLAASRRPRAPSGSVSIVSPAAPAAGAARSAGSAAGVRHRWRTIAAVRRGATPRRHRVERAARLRTSGGRRRVGDSRRSRPRRRVSVIRCRRRSGPTTVPAMNSAAITRAPPARSARRGQPTHLSSARCPPRGG